MRSGLIALLFLASATANAAVVTVDFEGLPTGYTAGNSITQNGFTVSTDEVNFLIYEAFGNQTLNMLSGDSYFIAQNDGQSFDLLSIDTQEWHHSSGYDGSTPTRVIGTYAGGGTIEVTLPVPGSLAGLETAYFDAAWTGLASVEIIGGGNNGFYLDNVSMSAVPVPAAVWLFGSALAGLGWTRRRQAAA